MASVSPLVNTGSPAAIPPDARLLIRGVNWLGDAVMTTPALQRLRERFPKAHITLLTPDKLSDLWLHHPGVNQTIGCTPGESVWSVGQRLRAGKFAAALVLPNSPRSALEVWLARIPCRIGFARPWRNWCLTQALPPPPGEVRMLKRSASEVNRLINASEPSQPILTVPVPSPAHHIHQYLTLAAFLGADATPLAPSLHVLPTELQNTSEKFGLQAEPHGQHRLLLGLNPGAEYGPAKRWPMDRFVLAAVDVQRQTKCRWLIFGGQRDVELANEISHRISALCKEFTHYSSEALPPVNLAGKTTLRELCALLKLCRVVLTNDTGPMHVAAAVGTPVVVPLGSTSWALTAPGLPGDPSHQYLKGNAPCAPCFRRECPIDLRCMTSISVADAVDAVLRAIAPADEPGRDI